MKLINEKIEWVIAQHKNTNHMYAEYLPYEYHLRMVVGVFERFKHLVEEIKRDDVKLACFGHDLIEDARISYSDLKKELGEGVADLVYALTNEKGKTRKERANDKYYEGIKTEKYGVFIKMCDRIANVEYSKISGSRMFDVYKKENDNFINKLGIKQYHMCYPMKEYLDKVFEVN
jgi:(p)ppGpp synthase/HD superfamily hydrolase